MIVGRESELPAPGRFFTHDAADVALLITRDTTGAIRAMLNVCRHRSARLVFEEEGTTDAFVCKYHAWRYDLAGRLHQPGRVSLPAAAQQFVDDCALVAYPTELRHGFVWVLPSPRAQLDVASALGPLDDLLSARDTATHELLSRRSETRASNWKAVVESYLPRAALVFPSSLLVFHETAIDHVAVIPTAIDETRVVTTKLMARDVDRPAARFEPTTTEAFHGAIDRLIAAHPSR